MDGEGGGILLPLLLLWGMRMKDLGCPECCITHKGVLLDCVPNRKGCQPGPEMGEKARESPKGRDAAKQEGERRESPVCFKTSQITGLLLPVIGRRTLHPLDMLLCLPGNGPWLQTQNQPRAADARGEILLLSAGRHSAAPVPPLGRAGPFVSLTSPAICMQTRAGGEHSSLQKGAWRCSQHMACPWEIVARG